MAIGNDSSHLRHISLSHSTSDSQASALRLIFTLFPEWEHSEGEVKLTRFTDGITNTVDGSSEIGQAPTDLVLATQGCETPARLHRRATRRRSRSSTSLRQRHGNTHRSGKFVYTKPFHGMEAECSTEETASHLLLASHNLAQPLLARFQNGMIYRFIRGKVCTPADLTKESVWRATANRLGQWHAVLPIHFTAPAPLSVPRTHSDDISITLSPLKSLPPVEKINAITPGKVTPNVWTIMQKWIFALPGNTERERVRNSTLQKELERTVAEFADLPGPGEDGLVLAHCDLLSGNVIMEPSSASSLESGNSVQTVSFIDYEYATPAPAAFDLANHFAEWGGFDCDYNALPTRSTRRSFLSSYVASYRSHLPPETSSPQKFSEADLDNLCELVDRFRGIPGFYWGIWALIQATISQIDFDYASYAEVRLGEYWAWREVEGTVKGELGLRERRWMQE